MEVKLAYMRPLNVSEVNEPSDDQNIDGFVTNLKDKEKSSVLRSYSASALGWYDTKQAVIPLITALKDDDKKVREYAAIALGQIGDDRAIEPLTEALHDEDDDVREYSIRTLGQIGDKRVIPVLLSILQEELNEQVRSAIAKTIEH